MDYRLLGGILLVSGTTIGAGMLALPVVTGLAGFYPSVALFIFYWIYMTYTAFLMLEVNLWMAPGTNLITMAKHTLGRAGEVVSWVIYLFLLYTLTAAYLAGGGPIFGGFLHYWTGWQMPDWAGPIPLLLIFGFFVYKGTKSVDYVNRVLMIGLVVTYVLMVIFLTTHVQPALLAHIDLKYILMPVSVVATSFGFHIIIPTLTTYLQRDERKLKTAILIGSLIPLVVYMIWEFLVLGIIPLDGTHGLTSGYLSGRNGANLIASILDNPWLSSVAHAFSFFAIVTSFLGVSLSLSDFLADGFKTHAIRWGRGMICLLTFFPPLLFIWSNPRAFFDALEYAGAFGVVILLGFLPALMVWRGRYHQRIPSTFKTPGGKLVLVIIMGISLTVMALEVANKSSLLPRPAALQQEAHND
jgi:tyrosine-specific transport protein